MDTKCKNGVLGGSQWLPKITENITIRYRAYEFLLAFHSNYTYVPILHRF